MSENFSEMKVVDLRKYAKDHGIVLGAGLNKADIIAKITAAEGGSQEAQLSFASPEAVVETPEQQIPAAPVSSPVPAGAPRPAPAPSAGGSTTFRAVWHNPSNRYTGPNQHTPYTPGAAPVPPAPRPAAVRTARVAPRFGPGATAAEPRTPVAPTPRTPVWSEEPRPAPVPSPEPPEPAVDAFAPQERPQEPAGLPISPSAQELITPEELKECSGIMETHPDGYAFLRVNGLLASSSDIYIAAAQIKRFRLRAGDQIVGKVRPTREGDKYAAMLTVTEVNGKPAEESIDRPQFDTLTATYPTRQINLTPPNPALRTMRVLDLTAPLGFGQRVLMLCQPDSGKAPFMRDLANTILYNHPTAKVFIVLLDENPEDVTLFRDAVRCPVYATTFDQNPENHLRMSELAMERAARLAESGEDVVMLVDSLTRLSKAYTLAAAQQGRAMPGSINPTSLYRAKHLFGAARALREGGSITVIGTLNISTGNRADDTIIEEFREAANATIFLDNGLARVGVRPTISYSQSGTRRCDGFLSDTRREGIRILRREFNGISDSAVMRHLNELLDKVPTNDKIFERLPEWVELLHGDKQS